MLSFISAAVADVPSSPSKSLQTPVREKESFYFQISTSKVLLICQLPAVWQANRLFDSAISKSSAEAVTAAVQKKEGRLLEHHFTHTNTAVNGYTLREGGRGGGQGARE